MVAADGLSRLPAVGAQLAVPAVTVALHKTVAPTV